MKRFLFSIVLGLGLTCKGESFYQNYTYTGTNSIAITNVGINPIFISGVSCQFVSALTGTVTVTKNSNLLYTFNLTNNTSYLLVKSDLAGVWLVKNDILSIVNPNIFTNTLVISTEENR